MVLLLAPVYVAPVVVHVIFHQDQDVVSSVYVKPLSAVVAAHRFHVLPMPTALVAVEQRVGVL